MNRKNASLPFHFVFGKWLRLHRALKASVRKVTWLSPPLCTEDLVEKNAMKMMRFVSAYDRKKWPKRERISENASNRLNTFWIYARTAGQFPCHQGHSLTHTWRQNGNCVYIILCCPQKLAEERKEMLGRGNEWTNGSDIIKRMTIITNKLADERQTKDAYKVDQEATFSWWFHRNKSFHK